MAGPVWTSATTGGLLLLVLASCLVAVSHTQGSVFEGMTFLGEVVSLYDDGCYLNNSTGVYSCDRDFTLDIATARLVQSDAINPNKPFYRDIILASLQTYGDASCDILALRDVANTVKMVNVNNRGVATVTGRDNFTASCSWVDSVTGDSCESLEVQADISSFQLSGGVKSLSSLRCLTSKSKNIKVQGTSVRYIAKEVDNTVSFSGGQLSPSDVIIRAYYTAPSGSTNCPTPRSFKFVFMDTAPSLSKYTAIDKFVYANRTFA